MQALWGCRPRHTIVAFFAQFAASNAIGKGKSMSQHLRLLEYLFLMISLVGVALAVGASQEDNVRKAVSGIQEAWKRHDMEAFGKLFAADADFVNVAGDWWKGRNAIQMNHAYAHGTILAETQAVDLPRAAYGIFNNTTLRLGEVDVRFLRDDVALIASVAPPADAYS